jgi:hypothetical protein
VVVVVAGTVAVAAMAVADSMAVVEAFTVADLAAAIMAVWVA